MITIKVALATGGAMGRLTGWVPSMVVANIMNIDC
jgi:hypothetical protein